MLFINAIIENVGRKIFIPIILLLLVASLATAAYLKFGRKAEVEEDTSAKTTEESSLALPEKITPPKKEISPTPLLTPPSVTTQTIEDPSGYFSLQVPEDWSFQPGLVKGARLAEISIESPDYKMTVDDTVEGPHSLIYYEQGALVTVVILEGEQSAQDKPAMAMVEEEKTTQVAGVEAAYFVFKEPSTAKGILREVRFAYQGNSYSIRMGYNPQTYPQGDEVFDSILSSFTL